MHTHSRAKILYKLSCQKVVEEYVDKAMKYFFFKKKINNKLVKKCGFVKPNSCKRKNKVESFKNYLYFHSCVCNFFHHIKFTNITNNEEVVSTFSDREMDFDSDYFSVDEKIENALINKLTIKINSKNCYYLKLRIPIFHRQFLKILSQNPNYCNDGNKHFPFAIRKWPNSIA